MIVEIYSKDNCIFCEKALSLATMKGLDVTVKKLDVDFDMQGLIEKFPTARTFPQLIVDDEAIGGYTEFAALVEQS
jgi:glutaredoxin 3|tara:strand:+ start:455 stop:682 length:228 start_codon:yes stop_codon:yes gene_type:complete